MRINAVTPGGKCGRVLGLGPTFGVFPRTDQGDTCELEMRW